MSHRRPSARLLLSAYLIVLPALLAAAPKAKSPDAPAAEAVDIFDAIKADEVTVKFIAVSDQKANLVIENKTKKPLTIKIPDAVAGMPVLGQLAAGGDAAQGLGGGAPGGPFNIAPEKTRKVELACLCLEHGKPDPTAKMTYELKPITAISDKPEVAAVVARYVKGDVSNKAAQAAAWHLQNGMSWDDLVAKELKHVRGPNEPYFTRQEIAQAMKLTKAAVEETKGQRQSSPSDSYQP